MVARLSQRVGLSLARKGRLLIAAALASAVLSACGGGGDVGSPAAAAPPPAASAASGGLAGVASAKGATTLSWQPPMTNDDGTPARLTGYRIYWGLSEDHYPNSVTLNNPGLTRHVVENLAPNTYYFVATALSADGESEPSNVIAMKVL